MSRLKVTVHLLSGSNVQITLDEATGAKAHRDDLTISYDCGEGLPSWTFPWANVAYISVEPVRR